MVLAYSGGEPDFIALTIIFSGTNGSFLPSRFFTMIIPITISLYHLGSP